MKSILINNSLWCSSVDQKFNGYGFIQPVNNIDNSLKYYLDGREDYFHITELKKNYVDYVSVSEGDFLEFNLQIKGKKIQAVDIVKKEIQNAWIH